MMRRSFGGGDGAGSRGGGMLRSVHRAVHGGGSSVGSGGEHFSRSTSPPKNTTPKSPTSYNKTKTTNALTISNSANNTPPFYNPFQLQFSTASDSNSEEFGEWECIENGEIVNEKDVGFYCDDNIVFGSVPSPDEVQHAVSSLHRVLDPISYSHFIKDNAAYGSEKDLADQTNSPTAFVHRVPSYGSEVDWMEPSLQLCNARSVKPPGSDRLYDAFHLLQTEPLVKRMVLSLSSDRAVWDAVLNNEVVREVKQTLAEAESSVSVRSVSGDGSDDSEGTRNILSWIFGNTKAKLMELVDKITKMVDELFLHTKSEKKSEQVVDSCFEERLRTSVMLSVVVFLIVVVSRASRA